MVAESAVPPRGAVVPGISLANPQWLAERIADMGISWGTGHSRVSGTLWWCMAASSLIDPITTAYAEGRRPHRPDLEHLECEIRPDGGVERVRPILRDPAADEAVLPETTSLGSNAPAAIGIALRDSVSRIVPAVAEVSGASVASLWAIAADTIGNRALDAGDPEAGTRLAHDVAGRLPLPRFAEVGGRTFVRRISCCLVFEVPGCRMCTSCPKRPNAERDELLAELAARS